jgi:two-component system, response regulator YesN
VAGSRGEGMYRFLMVDDEEIVRRGFRRKIDWASLGFDFLEPCQDGQEAIEAIDRLRPDVVMTDITMPHVDGLKVASYAAEHHPHIVIIILSGYDEFEYAQKAIRANAFDYVLKPVTSRELTALLTKLKTRLDAERRSRAIENTLQERARLGDTLHRTQSLLELVTGGGPARDEKWFEETFAFAPRGLACAALVAEQDAPGEGEEPGAAGVLSAVQNAAGSARWALTFSNGESRAAALVFQADCGSCSRVAASMAGCLAAAEGARLTVGLGRTYPAWKDAPRAYDEAVAALAYRLVSAGGTAFVYAPAQDDDPDRIADLRTLGDRLCRVTVGGDAREAAERAADLLRALREAGLSPQRVRHEVDALFASVIDSFNALGLSAASVSEGLGVDYYRVVERLHTSEELTAFLARLSEHARHTLAGRNLPTPRWKALDVREYVGRHFAERDLSVQKVAESLSISASYLSKLVQRYFHQSFVEYLTACRIRRAQELLSTTDLMTYEIAEAIGYPDARYFSSLFKKQVALTPSEFRARERRKSGQE